MIETQFFSGVTPLWVPPGQPKIPKIYHDPVWELAKWAGPAWPDNEETNFFLVRQAVIRSCEAWAEYNWLADAARIEERKADATYLGYLQRAYSKFLTTFDRAPFQGKKRALGFAFLTEFNSEPPAGITNSQGIESVERALYRFKRAIEVKDRANARFGAIEYAGLPRSLPRKEVAIALCLADKITFFRRDGLSEGTLSCPHKPSISRNLPWKAIALFASARCSDGDCQLDASNVQTLVTSLTRKIALVHW